MDNKSGTDKERRSRLVRIVPGEIKKLQFKFFRLIALSLVISILLGALGFYGVKHLVLSTAELGPYAESRLKEVDIWMNWLFLAVICISVMIGGLLSLRLSSRIAGPIYRIKIILREVLNTGKPVEIRIRPKDEFQELVELLNKIIMKMDKNE
ncbi:MAG: hypothetical protein ABIH89_11185 [Elusimicrobiota bacterium]